MIAPEYRVGFRILKEKIGLISALKVALSALLRSSKVNFKADRSVDEVERAKTNLKNHFKLLAFMVKELEKRYGRARTDEVMREVLLEGGEVFFRGFTRLGPDEGLLDFVEVYKAFERKNIVFDVIEETERCFEIVIKRCLVFESFKELGVPALTQRMCDVAFNYFSHYHPRMEYRKDRMIARGDETCHEVFTWN
jgi:hypothetical protein